MTFRKIRVLVVDDERIVRDFFKRLLTLLGLEVMEAEDGYKAIELAKKDKFDLFFLDVRMPGLDGLETYREIHKISPDSTVVMITGYAVEEMLEQAQKEGVSNAIRKPFEINQIKKIIDKVGRDNVKGPLNVLVVDDEEGVLKFFASFLKNKQINHKFARNKEEALAAIQKERFDLVFLDLILKDSSGLEVYDEVKSLYPDTSVVLITGYPQKAQELSGKIRLSGCLYKPFDIESIIAHIEKVKAKISA